MSEKCKTCDGTGSVPAEVETAEGPTLCPYIGAPCPDCPPMPERVIMVRESELEALREALEPFAETAEWDIADSEADSDAFRQMGPRAAVAGIVTVGHFRKAHEARARLDAALAHPTPDGCGREEAAVNDPKEIYLDPKCCADPYTGRTWAADQPWERPPECTDHQPATRYVRADLAHAELMKVREEIARLRARLRKMEGGDDG